MMKKEVNLDIALEKSRLSREKGTQLMNKAMFVYACFLFVSVIGFVNGYVSKSLLDALVIAAIIALILGSLPYMVIMYREEKNLDMLARKN